MSFLGETVVFLVAAIIMVPISRRLGFGSVLGYLAAGIAIGPFGLGLIHDPQHILHFAEFGVVLLLFIVGLELQPSRLWILRRMVFGFGSAQVLASAAAIGLIAGIAGFVAIQALVIGLILALSSTAFVLQMLAEKKQLTAAHGRAAFSILLFQDLAAIPMIAIIPVLGHGIEGEGGLDVARLVVMAVTVTGLIVGGRILLRPVLHFAAGARTPEIFTATALLVVIGAALLMQVAGMSMVLGAFIAGMLLADSEYRHQIEGDIEPFKGLLLGLFFIAVGMSINLALLAAAPVRVLGTVVLLMATKAAILVPLARMFHVGDRKSAVTLAAVMSQGGEFAFVLFGLAARHGILPVAVTDELMLAVAVSMLATPFLYTLDEQIARRRLAVESPQYDDIPSQQNDVIIAGFGRVGQIVARMLRMAGRSFTALEIDSSQVDVVRRYGNVVHYGDASRLDVLRAAGAEHARIFVLAIDDIEASVRTADAVVRNFPNLRVIARARNRRHAHKLMDLGIEHIFRETFLSSLAMSEIVLTQIGLNDDEARTLADAFVRRDERLLREQYAIRDSEEKLIQSAKDTAAELESLLQNDTSRGRP